jgi:hypothetical protein
VSAQTSCTHQPFAFPEEGMQPPEEVDPPLSGPPVHVSSCAHAGLSACATVSRRSSDSVRPGPCVPQPTTSTTAATAADHNTSFQHAFMSVPCLPRETAMNPIRDPRTACRDGSAPRREDTHARTRPRLRDAVTLAAGRIFEGVATRIAKAQSARPSEYRTCRPNFRRTARGLLQSSLSLV